MNEVASNVKLTRAFFARDALEVAPDLLGAVVKRDERRARIVEVEAYRGQDDPASHAFRGKTQRNAIMFGPPGYWYVYFTYGMHFCANVVCGPPGRASAVLIRALEPIGGLDTMRALRPTSKKDVDLCAGPARLCRAFGITGALNGSELFSPQAIVRLLSPREPGDRAVFCGPRIGLSTVTGEAALWPWRFGFVDSPSLSKPPPRRIDGDYGS